jgi:hypothetical protein
MLAPGSLLQGVLAIADEAARHREYGKVLDAYARLCHRK